VFLTLKARLPCVLCGYGLTCLIMDTFKVNKRSLRKSSKGPAIIWVDRNCPECLTRNDLQPPYDQYRVTPDGAAKVAAYRQQKWGIAA